LSDSATCVVPVVETVSGLLCNFEMRSAVVISWSRRLTVWFLKIRLIYYCNVRLTHSLGPRFMRLFVNYSRAFSGDLENLTELCEFSLCGRRVNPTRVPGPGPYQLFPYQGPHIDGPWLKFHKVCCYKYITKLVLATS